MLGERQVAAPLMALRPAYGALGLAHRRFQPGAGVGIQLAGLRLSGEPQRPSPCQFGNETLVLVFALFAPAASRPGQHRTVQRKRGRQVASCGHMSTVGQRFLSSRLDHPHLYAHEITDTGFWPGFRAGTMDGCAGCCRHDVPSCRPDPGAAAPICVPSGILSPILRFPGFPDGVRPGPARWLTKPQSLTVASILSRRASPSSSPAIWR